MDYPCRIILDCDLKCAGIISPLDFNRVLAGDAAFANGHC